MAHAHPPAPSPAAPSPAAPSPRPRALVRMAVSVTYPYLLGGGVGYLALTALSRDLSLMFAGALLVLYGAALGKVVQGQTERETAMTPGTRGTDGAQ